MCSSSMLQIFILHNLHSIIFKLHVEIVRVSCTKQKYTSRIMLSGCCVADLCHRVEMKCSSVNGGGLVAP